MLLATSENLVMLCLFFSVFTLKTNLFFICRYSKEIPDAYERLLLDAIEGERRLFIRSDELDAARVRRGAPATGL